MSPVPKLIVCTITNELVTQILVARGRILFPSTLLRPPSPSSANPPTIRCVSCIRSSLSPSPFPLSLEKDEGPLQAFPFQEGHCPTSCLLFDCCFLVLRHRRHLESSSSLILLSPQPIIIVVVVVVPHSLFFLIVVSSTSLIFVSLVLNLSPTHCLLSVLSSSITLQCHPASFPQPVIIFVFVVVPLPPLPPSPLLFDCNGCRHPCRSSSLSVVVLMAVMAVVFPSTCYHL